jgi:hypothetical protein
MRLLAQGLVKSFLSAKSIYPLQILNQREQSRALKQLKSPQWDLTNSDSMEHFTS